MAHLYKDTSCQSLYSDRKCLGGKSEWQDRIQTSTTLYVGNLSFYTTEEQLYEIFGRVGEVKRVVMGLDRFSKTPCGFCFVEYFRRKDTEEATQYINGLKLDDRIVRVDWDGGFVEGRQYGRGRSGGQVRDEYRADFDAGRGGWGKLDTNPSPIPAISQQPRRRSFDGFRRGSMPANRPQDRELSAPSRTEDVDQAVAKRSKVEANPRFREDREDDDEDD
mmetsp:Transcript_56712/g.93793  ORF Transcript_56712/g.93793 Transcript_56712/m.93793 type:complete len:220 (+) Transcript_56712:79-738(+)|eukprot:CAMPEP_0119311502 /NCGR_PEP_ID=MMETSP1333-20130426/22643_1 /TAXON_ID=418940 /ORGANISM="Scyphosphaera apsteinii, Strain RCC1455" /LENGTH=219 /DNA_ID=CAMNT_0007315891 /DNA_START=79 /DNA_END=738 /DNA_ORIENTATION=+